ncbi:MAG: alanyl-tRNA editing protein [Candidatus Thermoplasmatota archaeon]|nr:alanyl-tRNA editing protein [Candidatus Thermoplasmatota archaeon]
MTELLYMGSMNDCYIRDFDAMVVSVEDAEEKVIILDRTAFYPLGGGQPNDRGTMRWIGGSCSVVNVIKKNRIRHVVEGNLPEVGTPVIGELDWELRYAHMRMHTAQHLLSSVMWKRYNAPTVGNQIHADRSHIDFGTDDIDMDELKNVEREVNELISRSEEVRVRTLPREEIERKVETERVDLSRLPAFVKDLRTVFIGEEGEIDICPCAGTHVRNISELGSMEILKRRSKGAGKLRVEYRLS